MKSTIMMAMMVDMAVARAAAEAPGCAAGCPPVPAAVCAADGRVFANACLAECAGVALAHPGPCSDAVDAGALSASPARAGQFLGYGGAATVATAQRINTALGSAMTVMLLPDGSQWAVDPQVQISLPVPVPAVDTGDKDDQSATWEEDAPLLVPRRIFGKDSRKRVRKTARRPYRYVGEFFGLAGACTATVVSPTAILTSAHCLYDVDEQVFKNRTYFAPARTRRNGRVVDKFGVWVMDRAFMLATFMYDSVRDDDLAIVHLKSRGDGKNIGQVVGHAQIGRVTSAQTLRSVKITGYPFDKLAGQMWTSGRCDGGFDLINSVRAYYTCDTTAGISGSALMDSHGVTYGVHGYSGEDYNRANVFDESRVALISTWTSDI